MRDKIKNAISQHLADRPFMDGGQEHGNKAILRSVCRICGIDKTRPAAV